MRFPVCILGFVLLFFISGIACDLVGVLTQSASQPVGDAPSGVPTAEILFQDDFSNPSSGWSVYLSEEGTNEYVNGNFRVFINKSNWYSWSNPGVYIEDVIIDVDVMRVSGPEKNDYGVLCRYIDESNFYRLAISSDGYFGISKVIHGKEQLIGMDDLQQNTQVIRTGEGTSNHIRAECIGNRLTLFANGQILADVRDGELVDGDVGLMAGSYDDKGVDILFDNFIVTRP